MRTREPKPPPAIEDAAEYERFVEAARKLGLDESPDALDRAFDQVVKRKDDGITTDTPSKNR